MVMTIYSTGVLIIFGVFVLLHVHACGSDTRSNSRRSRKSRCSTASARIC